MCSKKDGSQTIDLFATVLDKGIYNDGTNNVNGSDNLVAPGTQGTLACSWKTRARWR